MSIEIDGVIFSGFPGRDFQDLHRLDFAGRISWVEYRFESFFLHTFDKVVAMEDESYVWLCVVTLLTSAVDALAHFEYSDQSGMKRFSKFVERYFSAEFTKAFRLDEPSNARPPRASTSAEHLYKYFRSGLAHSFCIEWGGLLHRQDGAPEYLFETPQGHHGERALGIVPRELVIDFRKAAIRYFKTVRARQAHEPEAIRFNEQFAATYLNKSTAPLPQLDLL